MSIPRTGPQVLDFFGTPLVIEPSPGQLSSDAGLLPIRQFDDRIGLTRAFAGALDDPRDPDLTEHSLLEMVRSRVYGILAGYEDQNDQDTLCTRPCRRLRATAGRPSLLRQQLPKWPWPRPGGRSAPFPTVHRCTVGPRNTGGATPVQRAPRPVSELLRPPLYRPHTGRQAEKKPRCRPVAAGRKGLQLKIDRPGRPRHGHGPAGFLNRLSVALYGGRPMKAWIYQDDKQVKKHGAEAASWYVGWLDPEGKRRGKSCGPGARGQDLAEKFRKKVEAELLTGTYQSNINKTWAEFRKEYDAKVHEGMEPGTREQSVYALDHFERIVKPVRMRSLSTRAVAEYVARRRTERGGKPGSLVSPATINKELRHVRAALKRAAKWKYLAEVPDFEFLKEMKKLPTYVPPEHFAQLYQACDQAKRPAGLHYPAADWWRGLLMTAYMTGWRVGSILALRRMDVDLDAGTALSRAKENKGKRDQLIVLHPVVIEHLRKLPSFGPVFFPWDHGRRQLFEEFEHLQQAAGVRPAGKERYGFHDLRRAFATLNADRLTPDALQVLMQHQDYQTTQRYINMARQLKPAAQNLFVPDVGPAQAQ
jgi:integrase